MGLGMVGCFLEQVVMVNGTLKQCCSCIRIIQQSSIHQLYRHDGEILCLLSKLGYVEAYGDTRPNDNPIFGLVTCTDLAPQTSCLPHPLISSHCRPLVLAITGISML